ncbi:MULTISPECIES: hypothetical protein [unclassified Streptomyces]|uniref:hypothetical protein n=1 Tax=unclassified Streptomyces TaxID=2593676 RepID=UPI00081F0178|nr:MULTISPECIES: hypothetical protein [unclassified Streptomyces]MYZ35849.1 hypothetical protein [Streptomyces sp. SID4917]SCF78830.1 hypothetical protein GA0115259_102554 [Streptomyces sp. MnatMP-M17]
MHQHLDLIVTAAPITIESGRILGSVGSGGIAIALTTVLVAGIREPKGSAAAAGGAPSKKGKIRKRLTSDQAQVLGITAGTFYMAAGSIWTVGGQLSDAFSGLITNGGFGAAGTGAVSLVLAGIMYFREMTPGKSALTGILSAGVWASAGGIWGTPQALILTGAAALGIL